MNNFKVDYTHTRIDTHNLIDEWHKLHKLRTHLQHAVTENKHNSAYAFSTQLYDTEYIESIKSVIKKKKQLNPAALFVIGIGGSNLGAQALQEALLGKLYNSTALMETYYVDTVDSMAISQMLSHAEQLLKQRKKILINVITKSGTTSETIANFQIFLALLKQHYPETYAHYVVVTTDYHSPLWHIANQKGFTVLPILEKVGGRFSVFSAVGLFPLGMLNCDIDMFIKGAQSIVKCSLSDSLEQNYPSLCAIYDYLYYKNQKVVFDMFLFCPQLEGVGKWYRQLLAESIGKLYEGQSLTFFPTVSIGSTDLHSVGQLYLTAPKNLMTTFVTITSPHATIHVPQVKEFEELIPSIQGKTLNTIMQAIFEGTQEAYKSLKNPFISIEVPVLNEYYLGQFLQHCMLKIIFLGELLKINPFDQPNVELYKIHTKNILSQC